jgi:hypothetical protein
MLRWFVEQDGGFGGGRFVFAFTYHEREFAEFSWRTEMPPFYRYDAQPLFRLAYG